MCWPTAWRRNRPLAPPESWPDPGRILAGSRPADRRDRGHGEPAERGQSSERRAYDSATGIGDLTCNLRGSQADPDPSDNTATADTTVNTSAEKWLDKQATLRSGNPSNLVTYSLVVHNDAGCETDAQSIPTPNCGSGGPSDARDIVVTDHLPLDSKKFVVQDVSPACTYTKATHTVVCNSAVIPAGASVTFVVEAQVSDSVGNFPNTASVTASTPDPVTTNNTNTATIVQKGGTGKK